MTQILDGGCQCGAVRYRIAGDLAGTGICHCGTCRRAAGAQSVAWLTVVAERFSVTRGNPASYASSPPVVRTFCQVCGTSLTYRSEPGTIDVTIASLDDPEAVPPSKEIWLSHRLSWEPVDPRRQGFDAGSEPA